MSGAISAVVAVGSAIASGVAAVGSAIGAGIAAVGSGIAAVGEIVGATLAIDAAAGTAATVAGETALDLWAAGEAVSAGAAAAEGLGAVGAALEGAGAGAAASEMTGALGALADAAVTTGEIGTAAEAAGAAQGLIAGVEAGEGVGALGTAIESGLTEAQALAELEALGSSEFGLTSGAVDKALAEGLYQPLNMDKVLSAMQSGGLKGATIGGLKSAVTGGDIGDVLKGLGFGALGGAFGGMGGSIAGQMGAGTVGSAIAGGLTGGATGAALRGGDVGMGALIGGLSGGTISGMSELGGMLATDPNLAIANAAEDPIAMLNASQNWTGSTSENIGTFAEELKRQGWSESDIASKLQSNYGIDQYAAQNAAGMAYGGQDSSTIGNVLAQDYGVGMTGLDAATYNPDASLSDTPMGNDTSTGQALGKMVGQVASPMLIGSLLGNNTTGIGSNSSNTTGTTGVASSATTLSGNPLDYTAHMTHGQQIKLAGQPSFDENAEPMNKKEGGLIQHYATGGLSDYDAWLQTITGKTALQPRSVKGQNINLIGMPTFTPHMYAEGGDVQAYQPHFTRGRKERLAAMLSGIPTAKMAELGFGQFQQFAEGGDVEGHNPEFFSEGGLDTLENTHVNGDGDGTSDSVPAMLADGEFVVPADVVSGLGNGSNKAGAQILDEFMRVIRDHKQKHDPKKLPPNSKGPKAYLLQAEKNLGKKK